MSKFKVGDRVKIINPGHYGYQNLNKVKQSIYTVIDTCDDFILIDINNDEWFTEGFGYGFWKEELELVQDSPIKSILFNNPYTTVLFNDGTKSIVKCHVNDEFDEYQGFVNAVAKHTLQMNVLEIAELIESKAKHKYPKQIIDDVIRVGDKVLYFNKEFYVTHIDEEEYFSFPFKISINKEDIGMNADDLDNKYGGVTNEWDLSDFNNLTKVKSK